jgi:PKD repeat protein
VKPPVASFSAKPTSGKAPLTVQFTDKSQNKPDTWQWNFGDGVTSFKQNPLHKYSYPGKYTVTLTVKNKGGSNIKTIKNYIIVRRI